MPREKEQQVRREQVAWELISKTCVPWRAVYRRSAGEGAWELFRAGNWQSDAKSWVMSLCVRHLSSSLQVFHQKWEREDSTSLILQKHREKKHNHIRKEKPLQAFFCLSVWSNMATCHSSACLVIRKNPTRGSFFTPGKMFTVVGIENNANKPLTLQEVVSSPLSEADSMLFELIR